MLSTSIEGDAGQVGSQPHLALGEGLGVGVDLPERIDVVAAAEEAVADPKVHLRPDGQRRRDQLVQRGFDRTLGGVFDGNDPPPLFPPFYLVEHLRDRRRGYGGDPPAEMGQGGLVAERGFRSQEGDGGRRLEESGGGEDLPENPPEGRL